MGAADATALQGINIDSGAPTTAKVLVYDTAVAAKWAPATLGAASLASDAVTTVKILDSNVTTAKLASSSVTAAVLGSDAVTTTKILDANVTAAKLTNSTLTSTQVSTTGGIQTYSVTSPTANATLTAGQTVALVDATAGNVTITLPAVAAAGSGQVYTVKKTDSSSNSVTISPASGTIDGAATLVLSSQYHSVQLATNATNWFQLGQKQIAGSSYAKLDTFSGYGSTKNKQVYFVNASTVGTDLSITQSTVDGDKITVNTTGGYLVQAQFVHGTACNPVALITKNTTDPGNTDPWQADVNGTLMRYEAVSVGDYQGIPMAGVFNLSSGDFLYLHLRSCTGQFVAYWYFQVTRLW